MTQENTSWPPLKWQEETERDPIAQTSSTTYEVYRDDGPHCHVATCYSKDAADLLVAAPLLLAACKDALSQMGEAGCHWSSVTMTLLRTAIESANDAALRSRLSGDTKTEGK